MPIVPARIYAERRWAGLNRRIIACELCPRLRAHCRLVAAEKRRAFRDAEYWGRPVPNLGDPRARLLIVGLAPAAHGANRTGRMFSGDRSGDFLFRALHKAGFSNRPSGRDPTDGLRLTDCAITATCHCAPPANRPTPDEMANCRRWLEATVDLVPVRVFLALGQIGWRSVVAEAVRRGWLDRPLPRFAHAAVAPLAAGRWLVGSYHPSQQNTFTGRLTEAMLDAALARVVQLLAESAPPSTRKS